MNQEKCAAVGGQCSRRTCLGCERDHGNSAVDNKPHETCNLKTLACIRKSYQGSENPTFSKSYFGVKSYFLQILLKILLPNLLRPTPILLQSYSNPGNDFALKRFRFEHPRGLGCAPKSPDSGNMRRVI
jgi:hypothetical protein